ncbi:hypothetical protein PVAP13_3KG409700 [Panicum virgatum]|uniref:Uncharacterized protein n=2 Tax=Panicum virgatum TaxID=38727 RepID=A0A8T0V3Z5_PANVG|nr:hypothetical protein PVAP13_3KG409700 [Panicum virgatum]
MAAEAAVVHGRLLLPFLLLAVASGSYDGARQPSINRRSFPHGFVFGTASSAYQYEGAAMEGGRGPSIWDTFTHKYPEKIIDGSNGDVADDQYHRYKEDVNIMKDIGMDAYRFSISWTRILPYGSLSGGVNREGVNYYNNLINELLSKGLQPFVTIFHWDSPQSLEDKYKGFLNHNIIDDYKSYAEVCFREFGDRVKHWITFNEPFSFCQSGYASGVFAPGRCSSWEQGNCSVGDSGTEPYTACHHQLLAHGETVRLYKEKYQALQMGKIGITLMSHWFVPMSNSKSDKAAARRSMDFMLGWFMHPLIKGEYPLTMRKLAGNRLPKFSKEQSELVKGAFDFIGLNYYTAYFAENVPPSNSLNYSYNTDPRANLTGARNGVPIGPTSASTWYFTFYIYPKGLYELLLYVKEKYGNPTIYITENGVPEINNSSLTLQEALKDDTRIQYYHDHLLSLLSALRDGANVKGYFAWSLLDDFEWASGYTLRFGINFVDYNDGLKRYPKNSAHWFKKFLKK